MKRLTILLLLCLLGCATTPVPINQSEQASLERVFAFQDQQPGYGTIVVIRDEGFVASGCYLGFFIDGKLAARIDVGERATFFLKPGERLLKVGMDPYGRGLCGVEKDLWTQRETIIRSSETKYFRLSLDGNGGMDVQRTDP